MPLVTTKEMFEKSMKEGLVIGAINVNNDEFKKRIVSEEEQENSYVTI